MQNRSKWCKIVLTICSERELRMTDIECLEKNGRIKVYKYADSKFKSENISLCLTFPICRAEAAEEKLLLYVLRRGTEKYPTQKRINERLDELYATLVDFRSKKIGDLRLLGLGADMVKGKYFPESEDILPEVLDIFGEILFRPRTEHGGSAFCEEYVRSEKENYRSLLLSQMNDPRTYAAVRCNEEMYSSLGIMYTLDEMCEMIERVTPESLYSCYLRLLSEAEFSVFYVGERDSDEIFSQVERILPPPRAAKPRERERADGVLAERESPSLICESADISQERLVMGFSCGVTRDDAEYPAMILCNEVLGASPMSKLMLNVREKLSLCYECSSSYDVVHAAVSVATGIEPGTRESTENAIYEQIRDMQNGKVSEEEMSAAKKSVINAYLTVPDSPGAIENFYFRRIIGGIDETPRDFIGRIDGVTREQVVEAAKKLKIHTVYSLCPGEEGTNEH